VAKLLSFTNKSVYDDALLKEAVILASKLVSLPSRCSYFMTIKRGWGAEHSGHAERGLRYTGHFICVHADCPDFVKTLIHEFVHVKDFCDAKKFGQYNRNWKNRPHEKRAIRGTKKLMDPEKLSDRKKSYLARLLEIDKELDDIRAERARKRDENDEKNNEKARVFLRIRDELGADIWMPKTLVEAWWKYRDRIEDVSYHRDSYDGVRIEMWTKTGWCFSPETHCEFEYSTKSAIDAMKWVEPCDCEDCKDEIS